MTTRSPTLMSVVLGVREELARPLDVLLIHPVLDEVLHGHDDGLLHLVRHDDAGLGALVLRSCFFGFFGCSHGLSPSPFRLRRVLMRAISRRTCFTFDGASIGPWRAESEACNSCSLSSRSRVCELVVVFSRI